MQIPPENGRERGGVETQVAIGPFRDESEPFVQILPLGTGKIGVRQHDAVRAVAHPIHQAQRPVVERAFREMVFDQQEFSADTAGFAQEGKGVGGVMQDVHEQAAVEGIIGKRQVRTIKGLAGYSAIATREDLDALDVEFRHRVAQERAEFPIAAAHVEETTPRREHRGKLFGQY